MGVELLLQRAQLRLHLAHALIGLGQRHTVGLQIRLGPREALTRRVGTLLVLTDQALRLDPLALMRLLLVHDLIARQFSVALGFLGQADALDQRIARSVKRGDERLGLGQSRAMLVVQVEGKG